MPIIAPTDVAARTPAKTYAQAFDRNGNGNAGEIAAFAQLCCDEAESEFVMCVGASVGDAITAGLVTEEHVKGQLARVALFKGIEASSNVTGDPKSPYLAAYQRVRSDWERLRKDDGQRLANGGGRAKPRAALTNDTDSAGESTAYYGSARDGTSASGY